MIQNNYKKHKKKLKIITLWDFYKHIFKNNNELRLIMHLNLKFEILLNYWKFLNQFFKINLSF